MSDNSRKYIFLADDDEDDCMLFEDALREVNASTELATANDGVELMNLLGKTVPPPPDVIFLDLNMPKKNGFECLAEIRNSQQYKNIPVVIFSTTGEEEAINKLYEQGANYFVRKPGSFPKLKSAIQRILAIDWGKGGVNTYKENFYFQY
ncbi:CheY chemotaxis protein or a CheY-like REC (receiver) domain [Dyadobacter koreensis]|uniref:CheY chemotaxis protein or a CheY-like REC (Receiver) domain n=1 Tax=Dyadobacter koreensis TaxID=408657 RepID=A0A1H6S004_9BACT|nr:response regulator [Dyadobacter koreensis]SEI60006.1 CheY chemotaxis protein or a CheY-like REC (receiver) domain [Dyadobacter koreensis]